MSWMFRRALNAAGENVRLRRKVGRLESEVAQLEGWLKVANDNSEGWRKRATLLYMIAPQPLADELLRDLQAIEGLEEAECR